MKLNCIYAYLHTHIERESVLYFDNYNYILVNVDISLDKIFRVIIRFEYRVIF